MRRLIVPVVSIALVVVLAACGQTGMETPITPNIAPENPKTILANLIRTVEELVEDDTLNQGQGTALTSTLRAAGTACLSGHFETARQIMTPFVHQIGHLRRTGVISEAQFFDMFDQAQDFQNSLP